MSHSRPNGDPTPPSAPAAERQAGTTGATREVWGTRAGFVLAAVGSAVGLGNMWRFPYLTAEYGGAAFVVLFVITLLFVGIPIMLAEFTVGRRSRLSSIGAMRAAGGNRWTVIGYLFVTAAFLILTYYSVIAGWVTRYALMGIFQGFPAETGELFGAISSGWQAVAFHICFMAAVVGVVMMGIRRGIERGVIIMMPLLFLLVIALAIWAATLPGSLAGYGFYLRPDMGALFSLDTLTAAAGQAFFSLSLGSGAMLTYASYVSKQADLPREATIISFSDFGVAFIAGLAVFPIIFAFGLQAEVGESAVGALFISLPRAFVELGAIGRLIAPLFFLALFIGALTSAFSMLEIVTAAVIDEWKISRKAAALGAGSLITVCGILPAMNTDILGVLDAIAGEFLLVVGALGIALFVGWRLDNPLDEVTSGGRQVAGSLLKGWLWVLRILVPVFLAAILLTKAGDAWDAIRGLLLGS